MNNNNLHTNNNTTGEAFSLASMLPRTTIIADSVNSGLAFFMSKFNVGEILINTSCVILLSHTRGTLHNDTLEQGDRR